MTSDRFRKLLECSICLDLYEQPKSLKCGHEFCQCCLEDLLVFRENGSATITCPLRCEEQTMLKRDETINDLGTPYTVKSMLDTYKADLATSPTKDTEPVCRQVENCSRSISVHCCGALMCTACHADHMESSEDSVRHRKRDIKFNKRENKLRVICNEHSAR